MCGMHGGFNYLAMFRWKLSLSTLYYMSRQSPSFYSELKDTNNLFLGARIYPLTPVNLSPSIRPVPN